MDTLPPVYDLVMRGSAAEVEETTGSAVDRSTPGGLLGGVETLLEGLDAVAAVYEPARRLERQNAAQPTLQIHRDALMPDRSDDAYTRTWARDLRSDFVTLPDGTRARHIKTGTGPDLLLLHTIRTQLDLFQRLVPLLASRYTVHAIDYPGFGWSDITPGADYNEPAMRRRVIEVIEALGLGAGLHLVGESIGGALALTVASQLGPRIGRVTAINTYDYLPGIERASAFAAFIVKGVKAPIVGPIFAALENRAIVARIVRAGVADPTAIADDFIDELARVGKRPGYSRVARAVFRSLPSYVAAQKLYPAIRSPVTLVYGDHDWSRQRDQQKTLSLVSHARLVVVEHAGHFASLEQPERLAALIAGTL